MGLPFTHNREIDCEILAIGRMLLHPKIAASEVKLWDVL